MMTSQQLCQSLYKQMMDAFNKLNQYEQENPDNSDPYFHKILEDNYNDAQKAYNETCNQNR